MTPLQSFRKAQTLVVVGTGGVGKTTTAAAIGYALAQSGLKVAVLTVDPAQRLASALGLSSSQEEASVDVEGGAGELRACLVQPRAVFDEFVRSCAPTPEAAERLLRNSLYDQLVSRLSGSQEFTSLERLYQLRKTKRFDCIILDTPPAQNAADFLTAPDKLLALFDESITRWFMGAGQTPGLFRQILGLGTTKALKSLEVLTGAGFIQELVDFFSSMASFQRQLQNHAQEVQKQLRAAETQFVLITGFSADKLGEAEQTALDLSEMGFGLRAVVVNRAQPQWLQTTLAPADLNQVPEAWRTDLVTWQTYYREKIEDYDRFAKSLNPDLVCLQLPEFTEAEMSGLNGIKKIAGSFV